MKLNFFLLTCIMTGLIGCASTPPYQPPSNKPSAWVKSYVLSPSNRHDSITIYIKDGKSIAPLYELPLLSKDTNTAKQVEANIPLTFEYLESTGDGTCRLSANVILQPNKTYHLVGGRDFRKGLLPILPVRICRFGMDASTGRVVS